MVPCLIFNSIYKIPILFLSRPFSSLIITNDSFRQVPFQIKYWNLPFGTIILSTDYFLSFRIISSQFIRVAWCTGSLQSCIQTHILRPCYESTGTTQSLPSSVIPPGLPFQDLSPKCNSTDSEVCITELNTDGGESLPPESLLSELLLQDHLPSITLMAQRSLLQETATVTMQSHPISPWVDHNFKTISQL